MKLDVFRVLNSEFSILGQETIEEGFIVPVVGNYIRMGNMLEAKKITSIVYNYKLEVLEVYIDDFNSI